jgi:ABC-type transport system involved in multi-copper enzyme maturation permease subunit
MFKEIFLYEIKRWLRLPLFYIYFGAMFGIGFIVMISAGGTFDDGAVDTGDALANAPFVINQVIGALVGQFGIFLIPSIMGAAAYRDFQYNMHPLIFTTRITRPGYLLGRYFGSMVVCILVFFGVALGLFIGTKMPFTEAEAFGPNRLMAYLQPYLTIILPTIIFCGTFVFMIGLHARNTLASYILIVLIFVLVNVGAVMAGNIDREMTGALLDPSGIAAGGIMTKHWTIAEQNTLLIPFSGALLYNRLLWAGLGLIVLFIGYRAFKFNQVAPTIRLFRRRTNDNEAAVTPSMFVLPKVKQTFSSGQDIRIFLSLTWKEFVRIVTGSSFIIITVIAAAFMILVSFFIGQVFGTSTYPVTYQMVEIPGRIFYLFSLLIIFIYSGILVNRERELKINQLFDTLPIPNWVIFASKLISIYMMCAVLLVSVMLCGILIQVFNGYYNFELSVYLRSLFGFELIDYLLIATLAMFVQVLVRNRYVSFFILLAYFIFTRFQSYVGIEQKIFEFAGDRGYMYSDMNGYGYSVWPYFLYKLYWGGVCIALAALANLLWVRGVETSFKWRMRMMRMQSSFWSISMVVIGLVAGGAGLNYIRYNTHVADKFRSTKEEEKALADFEKTYKKYDNVPQPRIVTVNVNADIYPDERSVSFRGYYILKNKTTVAIDSLHIVYSSDAQIGSFAFERKTSLVLNDTANGYKIFRLAEPLAPGDSMRFDYVMDYKPKGFRSTADVYYNGTFVNSSLLPMIGYNSQFEHSEDHIRKKYGLAPKERMRAVNDSIGLRNNYISNDADWVNFEAVVSTVPDQVAIAPGYLQKEWTKDGRRYFHYKMDSKTLHFFSFQSARYEIKKDKWKDVNIEIYYNKGHEYNIDRMITAVKKSLDYYTANFSPYQHRQVRIIEFPRYQQFAQSFANTIPYSEAIGFIAKVDPEDPDDVDYPFYVTAHEVAHQWWAHQVIGGDVQGTTVLTETMSQYSALMVMEKEYGRDKMRRFLKHELNNYLKARTFDDKEKPLMYNENQQYLHYNKGSLVMYALRDYIGEDSLNIALKRYIQKVAFKEPPYSNTPEFISYIKAVTPDSLQYLVKDMFETITLYNNKAVSASYTKTADGKYKVKIEVSASKLRAEAKGAEKEIDFTDYIDIGVLGVDSNGKEKELYLKKHQLKKGNNTFEVIVSEEPKKAGIDIYNKLIERGLGAGDDNMVSVRPEASEVAKK